MSIAAIVLYRANLTLLSMSTLKHGDSAPACVDAENIFPSSTVVFIMACIGASPSHSETCICIDIGLNLRFGIRKNTFCTVCMVCKDDSGRQDRRSGFLLGKCITYYSIAQAVH